MKSCCLFLHNHCNTNRSYGHRHGAAFNEKYNSQWTLAVVQEILLSKFSHVHTCCEGNINIIFVYFLAIAFPLAQDTCRNYD